MALPGALPPPGVLNRASSFPVQNRIVGPAPLRTVASFNARPALAVEPPLLSARGGPLYSALPQGLEPRPGRGETDNWGGTRGLFFEADYKLADEDNWQFVGRGRGGYTKVPEYRFVGVNQGEFAKGGNTVYSWRLRTHCLMCMGCVLLLVVGLFFWLLFDPDDPLGVEVPMLLHTEASCRGSVHRWSHKRRTYCCERHGRGCSTGHGHSSNSSEEHKEHHCGGSPDSWSAEKRKWCCANRLQGCNATEESLGTGCRTLCDYEGVSAPCRARVQWAADHIFRSGPGHADSCRSAYDVVMVQCPACEEEASGCDQESMGCSAGEDGHSEAEGGCVEKCTLGGVEGTCASHVSRFADSRFAEQQHSCALGLGLVLYGCPGCSMCTLASTGCEASGGKPSSFQSSSSKGHLASASKATSGLHHAAKHHLGRATDSLGHLAGRAGEAASGLHHHVGHHLGNAKDSLGDAAGRAGEATSGWHDAATPHLENAKDSFGDAFGRVGGAVQGFFRGVFGVFSLRHGSVAEEESIGDHHKSSTSKAAPDDADDGDKKQKKKHDGDAFDCNKDFDTGAWEHNWSGGQKLFCCSKYARGCEGEDSAIDCKEGEVADWSTRKKAWCCEKESRGCRSEG